jgi:hypothetical protein
MDEPVNDKEIISDVQKSWTEATNDWKPWRIEAMEDEAFYNGDQWDSNDTEKLKKEGRPVLTINSIKKPCDVVSGSFRQNAADIKVFPLEGEDVEISDILTRLVKWCTDYRGNRHYMDYSFDSAVRTGLGWLAADIRYDRDLEHGDLYLKHIPVFNIFPDPTFRDMDLSDCQYILRYSWLSKHDIKLIYPDADVSELTEENPINNDVIHQQLTGKRVNVIEKWYRTFEPKSAKIDLITGQVSDHDGTELDETQFSVITKQVPIIRLRTVAGFKTVLYDGPSPYDIDMYPFFPWFGSYNPNTEVLKYRIQGLVRLLKDSQREKNRRRSQTMYAVMSVPQNGYIMEKGAVDNSDKLMNRVQGVNVIEVNPGKMFKEINSQPIPNAFVQLEEMHGNDMRDMGPNLDLQGFMQSKSEPGMNVQMRLKQGQSTLQEFFSNAGFTKKMLGRFIVKFVSTFSAEKIQRITGKTISPDFFERLEEVELDTTVDEVADSPTAKMAHQAMLLSFVQQGIPIPPELIAATLDVGEDDKKSIMEPLREKREIEKLNNALTILKLQNNIKQLLAPPPPPVPPPGGGDPGQEIPVQEMNPPPPMAEENMG